MPKNLTAQRDRLRELDVTEERISRTDRYYACPPCDGSGPRGGPRGDTFAVPELAPLARSVPDACAIGDDLAARGIELSLGQQVYDPMGKTFFNILSTFAEFEVDLLRMRTREGMAVARAKSRLPGRQSKLWAKQRNELRHMHGTGEYTIAGLAELFAVSRPIVYRTLQRGHATHPEGDTATNGHPTLPTDMRGPIA